MKVTTSVADLCKKYYIGTARFYCWEDLLMNSAKEIFEDRGLKSYKASRIVEKERKNARLKDKIAEMFKENLDLIKKLAATE
jgi:hypothetical protein